MKKLNIFFKKIFSREVILRLVSFLVIFSWLFSGLTLSFEPILSTEVKKAQADFQPDWGVVAFNTNKSIYHIGDEVSLQLAVLDANGKTDCQARVDLTITNKYTNKTAYFSTETKSTHLNSSGLINLIKKLFQQGAEVNPIFISPTCAENKSAMPDYSAQYQVTAIGVYDVAITTITKNGSRQVADQFVVKETIPFEIERIAPTRTFPAATYRVLLKIKANQDFKGLVTDNLPIEFNVKVDDKLQIKNQDKINEISWQVDWQKGEDYELAYQFTAPNLSPAYHFLGPLKIGQFQEARNWQIAGDASTTLRPNAAGTYQGWATFGSGSSNWERVSDQDDTTGVATTTSTTAKETENLADSAESGAINSVTFHMKAMASSTDAIKTNAFVSYRDTTTSANTAKVRDWTGNSGSWGSQTELSTAGSPVRATKIAVSPLQSPTDQKIVVSISDDGYLDASVWDGTSWTTTNNIANAGTTAIDYRPFDIAFEKTTGRALLVYSIAAASNWQLGYKTWSTSTGWSSESTYEITNSTTQTSNWVVMAADPGSGSNEIAVEVIGDTTQKDVYGIIWNGSNFSSSQVFTLTSTVATNEDIGIAYEQSSGYATFIYSYLTDAYSWQWSGSAWDGAGTVFDLTVASNPNWLGIKANPVNDELFVVCIDGSNDLNTAYWSGSAWTLHTEHDASVDLSTGRGADFAWEPTGSKGLLVWGTTAGKIATKSYTAPNTWGTQYNPTMGTNTHRWVELQGNPRSISGDVKILGAIYEVTADDIGAISWDGSTTTITGTNTFSSNVNYTGSTYRFWPFALAFEKSDPAEKLVYLWRTNSTDYESATTSISRAGFLEITETKTTNPNTGSAWTWTQVNALEVGARATTLATNEKIQIAEFWIVVDYESGAVFTQNNFWFYVDNDLVQPTDPWPAGGTDLAENAAITTSDSPPDDNDLVRIRLSVQVTGAALATSTQAFNLQYGEGSTCSSISTWLNVGEVSSSTALWRGESDSTPADESDITSGLLTGTTILETYEEQNSSLSNPRGIPINGIAEWDWLVQNNGAVHDTTYCFRMAKDDGTAFTTYTNYPKITTEVTAFSSAFEAGNGESFTKPYSGSATKVSFESELDGGVGGGPCTDSRRQSWFYFSMNNALNQSLEFTLIDTLPSPPSENSDWDHHKPVYSYDQVTWYRITNYGTASGNNMIYTFPGGGAKFTSDTVYIAHGIPYTYTDFLDDLDSWDDSPYVATTTVGNSVQGRPMPLVTIEDNSSPTPDANKKVYWFIARQHPMEPMGSYGIKGVIEFLIGSTDEAKLMRRNSIFKIIPMMNPDGVYQGWTTANAEYCNLNREWDRNGPNATTQTDEVYNAHVAINNWMNSGTPADANVITDFHTRCAPPGIYHSNTTWYDTDNHGNPYEDLWNILDGNSHVLEFSLGVSTGNSVEMFEQYHTAAWGNDLEALNVEGTTYDFVGAAGGAQGTPENAAAFGLSYTKTIWAMQEASSTVFALTQTDPAGSTTPPQYIVIGSPTSTPLSTNQYFIVLNNDAGGGIYNWYDRENDPRLTNDRNDTDAVVDKIAWHDGYAYRYLHSSTNATSTIYTNSGTRVKIRYTGHLGDMTGMDYTYDRVIWGDGRLWSDFTLTNNTSTIDWASVEHQVSVDYADASSFTPRYDNSDTTPTPGTDNWWGLVSTATSTTKSTVIAHYLGQTGGWVYDTYSSDNTSVGRRNWYADSDGPSLTNGSSLETAICYQIRPDNDLLGSEAQIDVWRDDIANPDTPTMTTGTFTQFNKQEGGLEFAASGDAVKFTYTNATTYTKKQPVFIITGYTANTAPVLKANDAYLDGETGVAHTTTVHISKSYTSYVDTVNDIAYLQYLNDVTTNAVVEIKNTFAGGGGSITVTGPSSVTLTGFQIGNNQINEYTFATGTEQIIVTDTRDLPVGWTLSATCTNFSTGAGYKILNEQLTFQSDYNTSTEPTLIFTNYSYTGIAEGTDNQNFDGSVSLMSALENYGAGVYYLQPTFDLFISNTSSRALDYTATMTITIALKNLLSPFI